MENALVRQFQGHRIVSVTVPDTGLKLPGTLVERPVSQIECACGWTAQEVTMRRAREDHFGSLAGIRF